VTIGRKQKAVGREHIVGVWRQSEEAAGRELLAERKSRVNG
jgi:hypothetical protein